MCIRDSATTIPAIFLKTVITIIVTFFITIDFEKIINFIKRQLPESASKPIKESKKDVYKRQAKSSC